MNILEAAKVLENLSVLVEDIRSLEKSASEMVRLYQDKDDSEESRYWYGKEIAYFTIRRLLTQSQK
jgi:hypothetical protein